ncbi:MAG: hypothetical protein QM765_44500 [Myxococcales bacterium]
MKFYVDNDPNTAGYITAALNSQTVTSTGTADTASLTLPTLSLGNYYIAGVFDNGTTQIITYVPTGGTTITVLPPRLILTAPVAGANVLPGQLPASLDRLGEYHARHEDNHHDVRNHRYGRAAGQPVLPDRYECRSHCAAAQALPLHGSARCHRYQLACQGCGYGHR